MRAMQHIDQVSLDIDVFRAAWPRRPVPDIHAITILGPFKGDQRPPPRPALG
jgi:hypothetical protein